MNKIENMLIREFGLKPYQVHNTVELIDEGNTIPFIARYRKEKTGGIDDQVLRQFHDRLRYLRNLEERRNDVRRLIEEQDCLTDEIARALEQAGTLQEMEDIYRPFKPKRRTRASIARGKGLEPLAGLLMEQKCTGDEIEREALNFINPEKGIESVEDALGGAMDIIAEEISDDAAIRKKVRETFYRDGVIRTEALKEEDSVYGMYYDFREPVSKAASHRLLAIFRGEKDGYLGIKIEVHHDRIVNEIKMRVVKKPECATQKYLEKTVEDAYKRLILPSIENEVRNELKEKASDKAICVFAENLKHLLLQPPVKGRVVMGLDPAYRTGCKIAVVDDTGRVLDTAVVHPTPPQSREEEAREILTQMIYKYNVDIVSIGNGTASRESELFVAEMIQQLDRDVYYVVVSEAGASVYSASKLGSEEFPDFDVALRSAVSIARRLQDPLAELVKIDPRSIGVGQYQHDMNPKKLGEALYNVVEDCVNSVGVDLNTASPSLLSYVSGINSTTAKNIVKYREEIGKYRNRKDLHDVKKMGKKTFEQCAGFLRIPEAANILDSTSVHPESYESAERLLAELGYSPNDVRTGLLHDIDERVEKEGLEVLSEKTGAGIPTLRDIIGELKKPGRDPRDELPKPVFRTDVMRMDDLKQGMVLTGTVRNVADFGAFVDIGVHQDGLVHISEMSDRFVYNPMDIVSVGDIIKVRVLSVDAERGRISLSMKGV